MQSKADLKSRYAIVVDLRFDIVMVQSFIDSRRLVVVECRFKNPCWSRVISLCSRRKVKTSEATMDSRILQHEQVRAMGR